MSKEKNKTDIVYALADYKQLVLAYKSKYTELVKKVAFWRTSTIWLAVLVISMATVVLFELFDKKNNGAEARGDIVKLAGKIENVSSQLTQAQKELETAKAELEKKDTVIKQLEQNVSNTSKKLVEKLLKEQKEN